MSLRASSWLRRELGDQGEAAADHDQEATCGTDILARPEPGLASPRRPSDQPPGLRPARSGLVPVVEDVRGERRAGRPTTARPRPTQNSHPSRPEDQREPADQEGDHDQRDRYPGDRPPVIGGEGGTGVPGTWETNGAAPRLASGSSAQPACCANRCSRPLQACRRLVVASRYLLRRGCCLSPLPCTYHCGRGPPGVRSRPLCVCRDVRTSDGLGMAGPASPTMTGAGNGIPGLVAP